MIIRTIFFALLVAMTAMSCKNDSASQAPATDEATMAAEPAQSPDGGADMQLATPGGTQAAVPEGMTQLPSAPTGAAPAATAPGTNPPHGQPGHVCGTQVGAPLNGATPGAAKPAAMTPSSMTPASTPITTSTGSNPIKVTPQSMPSSGTPTATAPGTNPPHGQPGHVCGTQVGAPLPKQ
jgi:hypothetical protein